MPDIYYQDGGNRRTITDAYYQDGASLRTLTEVWYQDGATLRQVWAKSVNLVHLEDLSQSGRALSPTVAKSSIKIGSSGIVQGRANTNPYVDKFTWLLSGTSSQYQIRVVVLSGDTPYGSALGTWLALSSDVTYTLDSLPLSTTTSTLFVEIRDVATSTIRASSTFTLTATQDASP